MTNITDARLKELRDACSVCAASGAELTHALDELIGRRTAVISARNAALEALILAEDVLSHRPWSAEIWPDGTHPMGGITKIRNAIEALIAQNGKDF